MMTMPITIRYVAIVQMSDETAAKYKDIHSRLTAISLNAHRFESINDEVYEAARLHLQTIEDADGDDLEGALDAADQWLSTR